MRHNATQTCLKALYIKFNQDRHGDFSHYLNCENKTIAKTEYNKTSLISQDFYFTPPRIYQSNSLYLGPASIWDFLMIGFCTKFLFSKT